MTLHIPVRAGARAVGKPISASGHCQEPRHRSPGPHRPRATRVVQLTPLGAPLGNSGTGEQGPELSPARTAAATGKRLLLQGSWGALHIRAPCAASRQASPAPPE